MSTTTASTQASFSVPPPEVLVRIINVSTSKALYNNETGKPAYIGQRSSVPLTTDQYWSFLPGSNAKAGKYNIRNHVKGWNLLANSAGYKSSSPPGRDGNAQWFSVRPGTGTRAGTIKLVSDENMILYSVATEGNFNSTTTNTESDAQYWLLDPEPLEIVAVSLYPERGVVSEAADYTLATASVTNHTGSTQSINVPLETLIDEESSINQVPGMAVPSGTSFTVPKPTIAKEGQLVAQSDGGAVVSILWGQTTRARLGYSTQEMVEVASLATVSVSLVAKKAKLEIPCTVKCYSPVRKSESLFESVYRGTMWYDFRV